MKSIKDRTTSSQILMNHRCCAYVAGRRRKHGYTVVPVLQQKQHGEERAENQSHFLTVTADILHGKLLSCIIYLSSIFFISVPFCPHIKQDLEWTATARCRNSQQKVWNLRSKLLFAVAFKSDYCFPIHLKYFRFDIDLIKKYH